MFDKLRRRFFPRTAVCLHIFYPDVALEILGKLEALRAPFTLLVTHSAPLGHDVTARLDALRRMRPVEIRKVANEGSDIGPFLDLLPQLMRFDIVCKLHTKRDHPTYGSIWRDLLLEPLIGSDAIFRKVVRRFGRRRRIAMMGPADFYMSAQYLMGDNSRSVNDLLSQFARARIGTDWGFFAGTMFWVRPEIFQPLADIKIEFRSTTGERVDDGAMAHAVERIFGLMPILHDKKIAILSTADGGLKIDSLHGTGKPKRHSIGPFLAGMNKMRGIVTKPMAAE